MSGESSTTRTRVIVITLSETLMREGHSLCFAAVYMCVAFLVGVNMPATLLES